MSTLNLAFAGTPEFALPALNALAQAGHRIAGVFTQPDRKAGRGRTLTASPVKQRALQLGLTVFQPASLREPEAQRLLSGLHLDALIVVAYGLILPQAVLQMPRLGCFNIHASLLPRWRGAAPIHRAILAGDARSGITIIRLEAGLDTGPMLAVASIPIEVNESCATLRDKLAPLGAHLMCRTLDTIADGTAVETPQPLDSVTYAAKVDKAEAEIPWSDPASAIERRVRAFNPWPVAQTQWAGAQLRIWQSELARDAGDDAEPGRVLAQSDAGIEVACGRGALRVTALQLPGRSRCSAAEFLKSQSLLGQKLGAA